MSVTEDRRWKTFLEFAQVVCASRWSPLDEGSALWAALRVLNLNRCYTQPAQKKGVRRVVANRARRQDDGGAALRSAIDRIAGVATDCDRETAYMRIYSAIPEGAAGAVPLSDEKRPTLASNQGFAAFVAFLAACRQDAMQNRPAPDASRYRRASVDTSGEIPAPLRGETSHGRIGLGKRVAAVACVALGRVTRRVASSRAEELPLRTEADGPSAPAQPHGTSSTPTMDAAGAEVLPVVEAAASVATMDSAALSGAEHALSDRRVDAPAATIAVAARGAAPVPAPVVACTLGGALQDALDVPPEAVALALDEDARAERRRRATEIVARLDADAADGLLALAPFAEPVAPGGLVMRGGEALRDREIWAIGDIHGDLLALECCAAAIARAAGDRPHVVLLLGDVIDDGTLSYDTMLRAMELLGEAPGRYALLAGNHDVALSYDEATGTFASDVEPGDLADDLNRMREDAAVVAAGRAYVRLVARAPRALFLPDGTLAAHGGVPQRDLWDGLAAPCDLDDALCRNDFVWCRASERARRRLPSRAMRGAEFGCEDFGEFCALTSGRLGIPLGRMLRGHDHFEGRFCLYERYRTNPIVGVNALSRRLDRELFGAFARRPVVARWRMGAAIDVFPVAVPDAAVDRLFGGGMESAGAAADVGADAVATIASDALSASASDAAAVVASDAGASAPSATAAAWASDVAVDRERGE